MKKFFVLAATALALLACVQPEELPVVDPEVNGDGAVAFTVYAQKAAAVRGGTPGDVTNANIYGTEAGYHKGFGVFAYYTAGEKYDVNAKPNFMYNQQVIKDGTSWKYEPVKYWPNEYGNAAQSDEVDYVTFFAYAPWTEIEPTTGEVVVPSNVTDSKKIEKIQKYNIISVNKNNATGDPIIKYVCDTDPATSVDLLWGVAAPGADDNYNSIITGSSPVPPTVTTGLPFLNLTKPANPKTDKLSFNLKHSLAKVKFTIDYIKDDFTPNGVGQDSDHMIDSLETRIFVRSFAIDGWETKGALNLNNNVAGEPLWKDYDGVKDLAFDPIIFNDGRKDGKEGDVNGAQTNEENQGLNPNIVENFSAPVVNDKNKLVFNGKWADNETDKAKKTIGVTCYPQLLFGGDEKANGGYFYVIPRNSSQKVNVTIVYDVETIDGNLANLLSDGATHGSSIENVISKQDILNGVDFEAGKQYLVKIHIGMTSVKVEAVVSNWIEYNPSEVDVPDNQPMPYYTVNGLTGVFSTNPVTEGVVVGAEVIYDEESWNASALTGVYKQYYNWRDNTTTAAFKMPWADRYNATTGKTAKEMFNTGGDYATYTAAQWAEAGYLRCWTGAIKDAGTYGATDKGSLWPVVAWDAVKWAPGWAGTSDGVKPTKITIKYGETEYTHTVGTEDNVGNKIEGNIGMIPLDELFEGKSGYTPIMTIADGIATINSGFKPENVEVRFFYAAAKKHTLYETTDAPTTTPEP